MAIHDVRNCRPLPFCSSFLLRLLRHRRSLIHDPQLPLASTLPQYPFRIDPSLRSAVVTQSPALNLLSSPFHDTAVFLHGDRICSGVFVDRLVEGSAKGLACSLKEY